MKVKKEINNSYSNLHYNYFNPISIINNNFNKYKRQRIKNSYVDIALEKRDFISYEISQKDIEKYKTESTKDKTKIHSSKSFNYSQILKPNKIFNKNKFNKFEINKMNTKSNNTTCRSQSAIIKIRELENYLDRGKKINHNKSRQSKINKKKINYIGSYKSTNKTKNIFDDKDSILTTSMKDIGNYFKEKNEEKKVNSSEIVKKLDNINIKIDRRNNTNLNNSIIEDKRVKRRIKFEEQKNNEIKYDKNHKIQKYIENNSFNNYPKKYNFKINNLKKRLLKKSISCPSINPKLKKIDECNKKEELNINRNELKENIHKILKSDRKLFEINKKLYYKNQKQTNNFIYIKEDEYNDNKLKKLLAKIPQHNAKYELKKYPDFMIVLKEKNINLIEKFGSLQKTKDIMPPNNLEDILLKKEIKFFQN